MTNGSTGLETRTPMAATMMRVPLSTNALLDRAGTYFAERGIVARLPDKSLVRATYAEVRDRARRLARALCEDDGVRRGEPVATLMWNNIAHVECYFGIPAAGAVLHTLNLRLAPEDIAYIMNDAGDRVLIVDDVLVPVWEKVKPLVAHQPRVIVHRYGGDAIDESYEFYDDFITGDASAYVYPEQDESEPMGMCYTSGTTGRPKGVVYSHRSMVLHSITECMPDIIGLSVHDTVGVIVPMFHANAWAVPFAAVMVGANVVLPGPHLGGEDLLDLMESERITLALGVPTIWLMILHSLEQPTRARTFAPGMRMLVGGAAAPASLIAAFERYDMHVIHGWGMTEMSPLGSLGTLKPEHKALPLERQCEIRALQGLAPPLVEMRIVDDDGNVQPWDGSSRGEIQARGPWITGDYHNSPRDPGKFSPDGWLRTGDVGVIDSAGYLRIVDRTKDLIKSGGEWISSVDLENAVMGHPAVAEAAVIAIPHPKWTERPLVVVVKKPGQDVTAADLRAFLLPRFARWQVPDDYAFVEALPRTSTGKFLKTKMRDDFKDFVSTTPG
jgi:fatty-acyl-CoA synthase